MGAPMSGRRSIAPDKLTEVERRALELLNKGMSRDEIAAAMGVTRGTINKRLELAREKLYARNAVDAARQLCEARP